MYMTSKQFENFGDIENTVHTITDTKLINSKSGVHHRHMDDLGYI